MGRRTRSSPATGRVLTGVALTLLAACGGADRGEPPDARPRPSADAAAEAQANDGPGADDATAPEAGADATPDASTPGDASGDASGDEGRDASEDAVADAKGDVTEGGGSTDACVALTCAQAVDAGSVASCAPIDLGCGVVRTCSPCTSGEVCKAGACVACVVGTWPNPGWQTAATVGDVNGDGLPDVVASVMWGWRGPGGSGGAGGAGVLFGQGNGTFATGPLSFLRTGPDELYLGDFDEDGHVDLLTADGSWAGKPTLTLLLGDGDGHFEAQSFIATGYGYDGLALGDVNGDGHLDVVAGASNGLYVLLGRGDGTFTAVRTNTTTVTDLTPRVAIDVDGDGRLDAVCTAKSSGATVPVVMLGAGDGAFGAPTVLSGTGVEGVAAADFDGDGKVDLVTQTSASASLLLGDGTGGFGAGAVVFAGAVTGVASADVDGDGKSDLALSNGTYGGAVLFGNGDGTFAAPLPLQGQGAQPRLLLADFNRDGVLDVDVGAAPFSEAIVLSSGPRSFANPPAYPVAGAPFATGAGDFDGDGKPDIATLASGAVSVLLGNGDATLRPSVVTALPTRGGVPVGLAVGDVDGDGRSDVVVSLHAAGAGSVLVLLGNGDGTFRDAPTVSTPGGLVSSALVDLDGDGHLDLVADSVTDLAVGLGAGDGSFGALKLYPIAGSHTYGSQYASLGVADFNGDGHPDLVTTSQTSYYEGQYYGDRNVLLGSATGALTPLPATEAYPSSFVVAADFNGDGLVDLASTGPKVNSVYVSSGRGDGTFSGSALTQSMVDVNTGLVVADLDGDGIPDLAATNGANSVSVELGRSGGGFSRIATFAAGQGAVAPVAVDLDGNGKPDLVVANSVAGDVAVLLDRWCHP